jgi:acetoacetate decarboxylase
MNKGGEKMKKKEFKLKGFSYPLTPLGRSSIVGPYPWHYGTEYLNILYRTDPEVIASYLPYPLEPGEEPDLAYVAFSRWWSLWEEDSDMPWLNPERTQYLEAAIWTGCSFEGRQGQICLHIWVDNDFSMARGWFMGFPKKLGQVFMTDYHPLNPGMARPGPGTRLKGIASAHGERLIEGEMEIVDSASPGELPRPMGLPLFHIRHFPSIEKGAPPSILELVSLGAENYRYGEIAWRGRGKLTLFPSEIEEHFALAPVEILGAFSFSSGYTFDGGRVLYSWV